MANDSEESGLANEWLDGCRIAGTQSSIRLVYSFQSDPETLQRVRDACSARTDQWKDARATAIGESALTGHAAELLEQMGNGVPLAVFELHAGPRGNRSGLWPLSGVWKTGRVNSKRSIKLGFQAPHLWLFDIGVGFVVFDINGLGPNPRDWLSALHHLRHLTLRNSAGELTFDMDSDEPQANLQSLLQNLLGSLLPSQPRWWGQVDIKQQLRSFATLYVARDRVYPAPHDFERRILYHVCELAPPERSFSLPDETAEDRLRGEHYCYAKGAHFVASREGCSFVAIDADLDYPFWSSTMPNHLRRVYFVTYLLTQYQRQAIELLRRKVAKAGRDQNISADEWHEIRQLSAAVKSHGYFVEVAQSNNHARFEQMVRGLAQVDRLFELTTKAVDEITSLKLEEHERMKAAAQQQRERDLARKQHYWTIGAAAVAFASLLLTFLNVNIAGITDGKGMPPLNVILLAVLFAVFGAILGYRLAPRSESLDKLGSVSMMKHKPGAR